jgi:hypothetical protein
MSKFIELAGFIWHVNEEILCQTHSTQDYLPAEKLKVSFSTKNVCWQMNKEILYFCPFTLLTMGKID